MREGEIVAAPLEDDNMWYRAEVCAVEDNKVDLYYGDFGDSCLVDKDRIRQLRLEWSILLESTLYTVSQKMITFLFFNNFVKC